MKKNLLIAGILFYPAILFSQIGINTPNPSAEFDLVSKDNSAVTKALKITNSSNHELLTVLNNGDVGINSSSPTAKLEIKNDVPGAIKIVDGTQQAGRLLTSDDNGVGTWQPKESKGAIIYLSGKQDFSTSQFTRFVGTSIIEKDNIGGISTSGATINLPKGKYLIILDEDIAAFEYGLFNIVTPDNIGLFHTVYGATLRASFIADFSGGAGSMFMQFQGELYNPNPSYYESAYTNLDWGAHFIIHKLD
ncbi:hypothetical protein IW16_20245 [Chryseobacterium vrystaatense]|uniref:Uncharacterized protein n=1 Tax=Chryseobacterium vrystaatense TaxID=307480 RepID=A0ABR4UIY3_9FLAO|nr:hypothetical protein IW16_20245 [Chryseobacterium vrystaatense]